MSSCAVSTCTNYYRKTKKSGVLYHQFPTCPTVSKIWVLKCKRKDEVKARNARICSEHFLPGDYEDEFKNRVLGIRQNKILRPDAVPSVNMPLDDSGMWQEVLCGCGRKRVIIPLGKSKQSSGTAAREEEPKEHIPLEPTIEIKEEPVDYEPTPSTSTDAADEEFILPHQESNTWTPPVQLPPDPVVEPQLTLSVANLAPPNHSEPLDGEQTRKRRKIKASTFVPSTNGPEASPQSPLYNFGESSNPGSSKDPRKDQFDVFGEYIAAKLRSLDRRSCAFAQRAIGDIIFEAEMGKYLNDDSDSKSLNNCAS